MPRLRARLFVGTLSIVAAAIGVEVLARALRPPPEYLVRLPFDSELGYTGRPHDRQPTSDAAGRFEWVLNEDGFRGPPLPGPRPPSRTGGDGELRVLFVGDSFLVGWGVREESLMPFSAERRLAELGLDARCFDVSCNGYGTAQELLLLRRVAPRVEPDVVVLAMYPGNDLIDNTIELAGRTRISPGAYVRPYLVPGESGVLERRWLHPGRAFFRRRSHAFALIEHRTLSRTHDDVRYIAPNPAPDARPVARDARLELGLVPREALELFRDHDDDVWDVAWTRTEALLRAFRDEVESLGARLVVVVIPHQFQVQNDASLRQLEFETVRTGGASLHERLDWNLPERRLAGFFEAEETRAVLLLEPLREALARDGASVYLHNHHLNGAGHELAGALAADAIAGVLRNERPALLAPASAPVDAIRRKLGDRAWVDFRADQHPEFLGEGWSEWRVDWGGGAGWAMAGNGVLALPYRSGRLRLHGWLPAGARVPVEVAVTIGPTRLGAGLIEAPGAFELSFEAPPAPDGPDGAPIVLVRIWASREFSVAGGAGPYGLILQAAGFTGS